MACNCENENLEERLSKTAGRRSFLTKISVGIGSLVGAILAFPLITAMLDPVTRKKTSAWRKVGLLDDFEVGKTKMVSFENPSPYQWSGKIAYSAAYIRREENDKLTAFSVNCAHLGCPVRWEEEAELFMCPCHGGVYYKDGTRAAGPPPRGLYTYPVRIKNNNIELETEALPITNMSS
ncbi:MULTISPECIES: ubiquinol-cytochrome c reductase iron-sulfur subunit [unclassified Leeuwenhoekiella]|uniref:QcrA and Rieske domain-containing protein n=1 Tax=unclassified Leeuwenhoekiella TaxID=2615029 RepID=UPI000C382AAA|nr:MULTISPECIES: ubiquinol-cytochrome c reductase iron-sulfur subunit [unclassified Leeuwenhoekiella]MAW95457.1 (2Fe-2S)-binding protein [Leeuwenhoekiella sp.]MBA80844.1 (2Fe-2S)-binding protein [Leeuwenhoekiella sp.]|tara:strand:- start:10777 stop:11313 length:537 start_codon:yes stop_codon:yes gene_type:complete